MTSLLAIILVEIRIAACLELRAPKAIQLTVCRGGGFDCTRSKNDATFHDVEQPWRQLTEHVGSLLGSLVVYLAVTCGKGTNYRTMSTELGWKLPDMTLHYLVQVFVSNWYFGA